uniref:2Fe-2S ferredoxin n=1 Tax=Rhizochromulina marina TaxID=1034831 RepID=A0A7S2W496_9STRA|mmetsp:Transcript_1405/g.4306  ORF Transcript_1405/g.4306 Transcript_1405/m.4306 type:complete len:158 (+) Transcript_1405:50-523(+)
MLLRGLAPLVRVAGARGVVRQVPRVCACRLGSSAAASADLVTLRWAHKKTGQVHTTHSRVGDSLLEAAHRSGIDLEGACEGSVACSTCHVVLAPEVFDGLPEASEEEEDMLDQAFGLTETSRLGCQVVITPGMHETTIELPVATRNFYVDGHVPTPH